MSMKSLNVKVRQSTFETNSSSAHTLVIRNDIPETSLMTDTEIDAELSKWDRFVPGRKFASEYKPGDKFYLEIQDGFEGGEFGREFGVISKWNDKIDYIIAEHAYRDDLVKIISEISNLVKKHLPNCLGLVVSDKFENQLIQAEESNYFGSIDHQSMGTLTKFLRLTGVTLEELIFNKRYLIITDSDECCIFDSVRNSGLINDNITTLEDLEDLSTDETEDPDTEEEYLE